MMLSNIYEDKKMHTVLLTKQLGNACFWLVQFSLNASNACLYVSNCSAVDSTVIININFFSEINFDTVTILINSDV